MNFKKFFYYLPIEFYFLLIPSVLLFSVSFFVSKILSVNEISVGELLETFASSHTGASAIGLLLFLLLCVTFEIIYDIFLKHENNRKTIIFSGILLFFAGYSTSVFVNSFTIKPLLFLLLCVVFEASYSVFLKNKKNLQVRITRWKSIFGISLVAVLVFFAGYGSLIFFRVSIITTFSLFLLLCVVFQIFYGSFLKQFLSIFLIVSIILFAGYSMCLFTSFLFKIAEPIKTANFDTVFMLWDKAIFKTNPGIWLINNFKGTFFETVSLWSYGNVFLSLSIVFFLSFFFNKKVFRKLILSFFISWMLAMPFWYFFPALSPDYMFRLNKLNLAKTEDIKAFNNFSPSSLFQKDIDYEDNLYAIHVNKSDTYLPISTLPSMHAAWGTIIAYSGIAVCPWLGIILVPLAVLNYVGAVYILEHFFVDIISGIILAAASLIIAEILLRFESKYFNDKFGLLSGFDYFRLMIKKFMS